MSKRMNVLHIFWISIILVFISLPAISQKFADSAIVFKGYGYGGSTANLKWNSRAVDTIRTVTKVELQKEYLDTLNYLIQKVKAQRHNQQKVGPSFYASIYIKGQERRIAIVPRFGIIDLNNKKQFIFRNTPYSKIFDRFVEKNYH
jgi:hypothetical protein